MGKMLADALVQGKVVVRNNSSGEVSVLVLRMNPSLGRASTVSLLVGPHATRDLTGPDGATVAELRKSPNLKALTRLPGPVLTIL